MNPPVIALPLAAPLDPLRLDGLISEMRAALTTLETLRGTLDPEPPQTIARDEILKCVRVYLANRRARDAILSGGWFADPVWDVLLDLLACRLESRKISISSACIAAAVPPTTALRWIEKLAGAGAIHRFADVTDGRRVHIELEPNLAARIEGWVVSALLNRPANTGAEEFSRETSPSARNQRISDTIGK